MKIRNVAIIAHVDHGKTTLVDALLKQSGIFAAHEKVEERVLDSNVLEKERGITILAKNVAVEYAGTKINIVDTPGHADFSGEVERTLSMVDGALLLVDAVEGPMPQTRFVLQKALQRDLAIIVVINKIDRPAADAKGAIDAVLDLFIALEASDEQLDFPYFYASAVQGVVYLPQEGPPEVEKGSVRPLLQAILDYVPAPQADAGAALQMLISDLDYDPYVGRIAIGRIQAGVLKSGRQVLLTHSERGGGTPGSIGQVYTFRGLHMQAADFVPAGDIAAFSGMQEIEIGETVNDAEHPLPLPALAVDEPTLSVIFRINDGPLAGLDSEYLTSRHLQERLWREAKVNVALRVAETSSGQQFLVSGRGELHLSVLMETMRREGYSFCVTMPQPILRREKEGILEPYELLITDVPQDYLGITLELVANRRGRLLHLKPLEEGWVRAEFSIPARGLLGFTSSFLTETKGHGVSHQAFSHYGPWVGAMKQRPTGSLIAWEAGRATAYGLAAAQERGTVFITPGTQVYEGMIIGEHHRAGDLGINVTRQKQATNIRAAGADELIKLNPVPTMTLEELLAYLAEDECLEVAPTALRLRKIILNRRQREREKKS